MFDEETWREFDFRCDGGGGCIMVEKVAGCVVIWDSKNPHAPRQVYSKKEYADFRRRVRYDTRSRTALRFMASLLHLVVMGLRHIAH